MDLATALVVSPVITASCWLLYRLMRFVFIWLVYRRGGAKDAVAILKAMGPDNPTIASAVRGRAGNVLERAAPSTQDQPRASPGGSGADDGDPGGGG
ncbi:hypothetical protein GCM10017691_24130 [Pseudonocardia petroleophila]|uniref:Uncharacterized protein n=1 Tax=Pseudonocardia petroleophila TaxID=37331 RepID=A0A7G7MFT2_9PSEU|nr:hypothetical protein [Pseudonocardia petroleophila]QNG51643.1 hypothetical protein H6H00_26645 [Pseudonocardia petroleophila]